MKNKPNKHIPIHPNSFVKAVLFGLAATALTWILLSLIFSFVMIKQQDTSRLGPVFSTVLPIASLLVGGVVSGKTNKKTPLLSSIVLTALVLGACYGLSTALDLCKEMGYVFKALIVLAMFLSSIIGTKIVSGSPKRVSNGRMRGRGKTRM